MRRDSSGTQAGSMSTARQKRCHSSSGPAVPDCGTVTTWTFSGGSPADHVLSTAGTSKAR